MKLADEQVASAKNLMHDGDNRRADSVLQRADSDAELAVMMTREKQAKTAADQARANLNGQAQSGGAAGVNGPMQQVNPITPAPTPAPVTQ